MPSGSTITVFEAHLPFSINWGLCIASPYVIVPSGRLGVGIIALQVRHEGQYTLPNEMVAAAWSVPGTRNNLFEQPSTASGHHQSQGLHSSKQTSA